MEKSVEIVVAGHLCLDLLPEMAHVRLSDLTSPGQLFETGPMRFSTGGAVSNTGVALHRLGVDVRLMSTVGDDLIGRMIVAFLEGRDPLLAQHITTREGVPSSYTIVLSPEKVDRIFLHCTGTNAVFTSADIDYELVGHSKIFHLGYPPLLPGLITDEGTALALLFQRAKAGGTLTSLDMTLPDPNGASGQVNWRILLERTLPHVDIFIPSIEEALFMLRRDDYDRWHGQILDQLSLGYLDTFADEILHIGSTAIVGFKLGEQGIYLRTSTTERFQQFTTLPIKLSEWANQRIWHPAFVVDVVGTTGAGDSAYAGFLSAMLKGLSAQDAARWSCAVGAHNVKQCHQRCAKLGCNAAANRTRLQTRSQRLIR